MSEAKRRFKHADLLKYDGSGGSEIYVAVKGQVFDVSSKADMYGPGGNYHVFAGKDASKVERSFTFFSMCWLHCLRATHSGTVPF